MRAVLDGVAHASCNPRKGKAGVSIELLERANDDSHTYDMITRVQPPFSSQNKLFYTHLKLSHSLTGPKQVLSSSDIVKFNYSSIANMEPVIVIVHDMWHTPEVYQRFISALKQAAFRVFCPLLPTCDPSLPPDERSVYADLLFLRHLLTTLVDAGDKVIVIMHGYGGTIGSDIPETLSFDYRAAQGERGGIIHLLYMCAYILPSGRSIWDLGLWTYPSGSARGMLNVPQTLQCDFFTGVDPQEVKRCTRFLVPIPELVLWAKLKQDAWKHIPCTHLFTLRNCIIWPAVQRAMAEPAKRFGKKYGQKVYDAGHSIYLTHTWEMVEEVQAICGVYWEQPVRQLRNGLAATCEAA